MSVLAQRNASNAGIVFRCLDASFGGIVRWSRGIAIHLNYQGLVNSIYYVSERIGLPSEAGCKKALESYTRRGKRN